MGQSHPAVRLIDAELPDFGVPETRPEMPRSIHAERFDRFVRRVRDAGLTAAVVYGDREHFANLAYLTGFDPRFEEALMVVVPGRDPALLTGPENQGTARGAAIDLEVKLYPPFGLLGQDRSRTPPLADLLRDAGIAAGDQNRGRRVEVFRQTTRRRRRRIGSRSPRSSSIRSSPSSGPPAPSSMRPRS